MVTEAQIGRLKALIKSGADAELFFSSIRSPDWIPALLEHGFFKHPPKPQASGDGHVHPPWPQTKYLARMAPLAPEAAVKSALSVPATDNWTVNDNILAVALAVPPELAAKLVPRIHRWLKGLDSIRDATPLAKLIVQLSPGPGFTASLDLFGMLASFLLPKTEKRKVSAKLKALAWRPEPASRFDAYNYKELLAEAVPVLARIDPVLTLKVLARILDGFARLRRTEESPPGYDGSIYWRPSIAEHDQNADHRLGSCLVSALRDCAEKVIGAGQVSLGTVLAILGKYRWDVFVRLHFHLARLFPDQVDRSEVRALLVDTKYRVDGRWDLEYGLLLRDVYANLTQEDGAAILGRVEHGPDESELAWMRKTFDGGKASPEQLERRVNHWRVKKLYWIREHLAPAWRARYETWVAQTGEPEHPGFHAWTSGGTVGSVSPVPLDEFRKKSLDEQIAYLRDWIPAEGNWTGPSREGLAAILQEEVKKNALLYLEAAPRFIALDPTYLESLIRGIAEGVKGRTVPSWSPLWELAVWILAQPDPPVELKDNFSGRTFLNRRWRTARLELARFVDAALKGQITVLSVSDRGAVWVLVEGLTTDSDPGIADESESNRGSFGPFSLSLNTVRGEAMNAVFSYVGWVYRTLTEEEKKAFSFAQVPEAARALEARLDVRAEPTLTIRSVYGANLNPLVFWDETWLRARLRQIFPEEDPSELWEIAWTTFIKYSPYYLRAFTALAGEYARAVRMLNKAPKADDRDDWRVSLSHHLMNAYWLGHADLASAGSLLREFFKQAPDEVRGKALAFVGRSLKETKELIEPEIIRRLQKLWAWRLAEARRAKGKDHGLEMAAFAWWFASRKFDDAWTVPQLVAALELTESTNEQFLWLEIMVELRAHYPAEAARALEATLRAGRDTGTPFWSEDEAEAILRAAAESGSAAAIRSAERAQDILLKRGHKRFVRVLAKVAPRKPKPASAIPRS